MRRLALLITIALVSSGCVYTFTITDVQVPELKTGSLLRGVEPRTVVIKDFGDERSEKELVGALMLAEHRKSKFKIARPVAGIVSETIAKELMRNGHRILEPPSANEADVIIQGTIRKYWVEYYELLWGFKITATVESDIEVAANDGVWLSKTYRGSYLFDTGIVAFASVKMARDLLNEALVDMIKQLTGDPEFLAIMREPRRR